MMRPPKNYQGDASLPLIFRRLIKNHYPVWVIKRIDRAGRYHDYLTDRYPNTPTHNRRRCVKLMRRFKIPKILIYLIRPGLWIYDHSPHWLQTLFKKTTY